MFRKIQQRLHAAAESTRRHWETVLHIIKEHREYRIQILQLANADILKTYRGSALGWMWAIIKPSVTIFVYWFAFTIGLRAAKPVNGFPFFLWLVAGIVPWFYMSEMLTQGSKTLNRYNYLVTKIKFPVSTISTFVSLSKLYVHLALVAVVVAIFVLFGYPVDVYFLQLPVYVGLMFVFFTIWSLLAGPLSAVSKDFANTVSSLVTAIFWMSGIMWDANKIDNPILHRVLLFNPVTFFATGYRNVFIYKRWFFEDQFALFAFILVLVGMFALSIYTYDKLRREIADVL
ncbi:MAG TPA: ABC transporter permease [Coriobacteriia bacterium]|nr:ABC transporter permease [Coriobacteriia bacterium]